MDLLRSQTRVENNHVESDALCATRRVPRKVQLCRVGTVV